MASPAPSRSVAIPVLIVLLLATHVAAAFFLSRQGPPPARSSWRIAFYSDFDRESEIVTEPGRPYRDFQVEYPPLVIVELKGLVGQSEADTLHRFAWTQLVLELAAIGALAWAWGEMVVLSYLVLTLPLVAFPYVFTRTDMLSVTLATLGMAAVKRRASSQGAGFLAIVVVREGVAHRARAGADRPSRDACARVVARARARGWFGVGRLGRRRRTDPGAHVPPRARLAHRVAHRLDLARAHRSDSGELERVGARGRRTGVR